MRKERATSLFQQPPPPVRSPPFPNCLATQLLHPVLCSEPLSMVCNPSFPSSTRCPKASYLLRRPRAGPRGFSECFFLPLPLSLPPTSPVLDCSHPGPLPTWNTPRLTSYTKSSGRHFPYSRRYVPSSQECDHSPSPESPRKVRRAAAHSQTYLCPRTPTMPSPVSPASFSDAIASF